MTQTEQEIVQQINFDNLSVALGNDGIMHVKFKTNEEIEIEDVKQVVGAIEKIGKGKKFPILIMFNTFTLPTSEARAYVATPESDPYASAEAYVLNSFSQRLVANVYTSFNKPARPTKFFTSEEKATEWLKTFL